jgi:hypothetical protein
VEAVRSRRREKKKGRGGVRAGGIGWLAGFLLLRPPAQKTVGVGRGAWV